MLQTPREPNWQRHDPRSGQDRDDPPSGKMKESPIDAGNSKSRLRNRAAAVQIGNTSCVEPEFAENGVGVLARPRGRAGDCGRGA